MPAGVIDVFELVQIDKEQCTVMARLRHAFDFSLQFFKEASSVKQPGQAVVVGQFKQFGVSFTEGCCSCLQRFNDLCDLAVFGGLKLNVEIAFGKLFDGLL